MAPFRAQKGQGIVQRQMKTLSFCGACAAAATEKNASATTDRTKAAEIRKDRKHTIWPL